jgi:hypothetical protein
MAVARTAFVSLDCDDPQVLGEFWAAMLGGEVVLANDRLVAVRTPAFWLAALKVDDHVPPTWPSSEVPKQLHLDLAVVDLDESVAEAVALGAVVAPHQPSPDQFRVLLDPAGHPFCVTNQIPIDL